LEVWFFVTGDITSGLIGALLGNIANALLSVIACVLAERSSLILLL
jgi:hypothetical protein